MKKILLLIFGIFVFDTSFNFAFCAVPLYDSCEAIPNHAYTLTAPSGYVCKSGQLKYTSSTAGLEGAVCIPYCEMCPDFTTQKDIVCKQEDTNVVCSLPWENGSDKTHVAYNGIIAGKGASYTIRTCYNKPYDCTDPNSGSSCTMAPHLYDNKLCQNYVVPNCKSYEYQYCPGTEGDTKTPCIGICKECNTNYTLWGGVIDFCDAGAPSSWVDFLEKHYRQFSYKKCNPNPFCAAGYYGPGGDRDFDGYVDCKWCPENSSSKEGTTEISGCKCNIGYYGNLTNDNSVCTKCPDNSTTSSTGSISLQDCKCNKGYYMFNWYCYACPENSTTEAIGAGSINYCKCSDGFYMDSNNTCIKCENGSTGGSGAVGADSCKCNSGYYKSGTTCQKCPNFDSMNTVSGMSPAGATSISQCYMTSSTNLEDTTGYFHFSENCQYKQ